MKIYVYPFKHKNEEFNITIGFRGDIEKIEIYSRYLDRWLDVTNQLKNCKLLTDEALESFNQMKNNYQKYDTLDERYG